MKGKSALKQNAPIKQRWTDSGFNPIESYIAQARCLQNMIDEGKHLEDQDEIPGELAGQPGATTSTTINFSIDLTTVILDAQSNFSSKTRDVKVVLGTGTYSTDAIEAFLNFVKKTEKQAVKVNNLFLGAGSERQVVCKGKNPYKTYTWEYDNALGNDYVAIYIGEN